MSKNLGTGTKILTPKTNTEVLNSLKSVTKNYRRQEKTGPALYELISAIKNHQISPEKKILDFDFEAPEVQNLLAKLRMTDSEKKKLHGHWNSPKENFTYLEPLVESE